VNRWERKPGPWVFSIAFFSRSDKISFSIAVRAAVVVAVGNLIEVVVGQRGGLVVKGIRNPF
jgi:hypothetical protein